MVFVKWLRPFPTARERGNIGEMIREVWRVQIEREEGRREPVPRDRRRPEAAELELDLELGCSWRRVEGTGGLFGVGGGESW